MNGIEAVLLILAVFAVIVLISPDKFSKAFRTRVGAWLSGKGDEISTVDANVQMAQDADAHKAGQAQNALYDVNEVVAQTKIEIKRVEREIADDQLVLQRAHAAGDTETFNDTAAELLRDQADLKNLQASLDRQVGSLGSLASKADQMAREARLRVSQGRDMVAQDREATVSNMADRAAAGLDDNGAPNYMKAAEKALERKQAKAMAAHEMALGGTPDQRTERKRQAYLQQGSVDSAAFAKDLWAQMDAAKAQPKQ